MAGWTPVQTAFNSNAGSGGSNSVTATFGSISTVNNVVHLGINWMGATTITSVSDEATVSNQTGNNQYFQIGSTVTQGSGSTQLNAAVFVGFLNGVDTVPMTITVTFSANSTKMNIGMLEANPGTTSGVGIVDSGSFGQFASASGPAQPSLTTILGSANELLLVSAFVDGQQPNARTGWTLIGHDSGGHGVFYQIMSSSGSQSIGPFNCTGTIDMVVACGALAPVNPFIPPCYTPSNPTPQSTILYAGQRQQFPTIYSFAISAGDPINPLILTNPQIPGVSVRVKWSSLQPSKPSNGPTSDPTDSSYNWGYTDGIVQQWQQYGKMGFFRILVEGGSAPSWLYNNVPGIQIFNINGGGRIWVYWDPIGNAYMAAMYKAFAAKYASIPNFKILSASLGSTGAGGWAVPHTGPDITNWNSIGYTTQRLVNACTQYVDLLEGLFPNQIITYSPGRNGNLDATPDAACEAINAYGYSTYGRRFASQKNGWHISTPLLGNAGGTDYQIAQEAALAGNLIGGQYDWYSATDNTYVNANGFPTDPAVSFQQTLAVILQWGCVAWMETYDVDCMAFWQQLLQMVPRGTDIPGVSSSPILVQPNVGTILPPSPQVSVLR